MRDATIAAAIAKYLGARQELLALGREHPERLGGNDNIIGRIGEFIALRFLEKIGQRPTKASTSSNPGYDLVEGRTRTQVKVITEENQKRKSVRLTQPWDQFLLIQLGRDYRPIRIGILAEIEHRRALEENPGWSKKPVVKLTMLGARGLIGKYGRIYTEEELAVLHERFSTPA